MKPSLIILVLTLSVFKAPRVNCLAGASERDCDVTFALAADQADDAQFVLELMRLVQSPLGRSARMSTAAMVAGVGQTMPQEQRRSWFILLAIESKFDQSVVSSCGALGMGQLVPVDMPYLARITGIATTAAALKKEPHINLLVSAALYKYLTAKTGSAVLALVAYNAGLNSVAVKRLQQISAMNPETANYVAKHTYILEFMSGENQLLNPSPASVVAGL